MTALPRTVGMAGAALTLAGLLVGTGWPVDFGSLADRAWNDARSSDLTATALTSEAHREVTDQAFGDVRVGQRPVTANTTAAADADCDGCAATATALQVLHLDRPTDAVLENLGVAWSRCTGCSATALSVQLVVLGSPPQPGVPLRADNRALSVNATCDGCRTAAVAYQLVVVDEHGARLTRSDRRELEHWVAALATRLRVTGTADPSTGQPTWSATRRSAADRGLARLERLVGRRLPGARTVQRRAEVRIR